jgi:hypothetical protein
MSENKDEDEQYERSCLCGRTDARIITFLGQLCFGLLSSGFYMYQLSVGGKDSQIYLPLLTATVATFLPNPSFKK